RLVRWHAAFEVDGDVCLHRHRADQVSRTERARLLAGVDDEIDAGKVAIAYRLQGRERADRSDDTGLVVARPRTDQMIPDPFRRPRRYCTARENRVHVGDEQDASLAGAGDSRHDIVADARRGWRRRLHHGAKFAKPGREDRTDLVEAFRIPR